MKRDVKYFQYLCPLFSTHNEEIYQDTWFHMTYPTLVNFFWFISINLIIQLAHLLPFLYASLGSDTDWEVCTVVNAGVAQAAVTIVMMMTMMMTMINTMWSWWKMWTWYDNDSDNRWQHCLWFMVASEGWRSLRLPTFFPPWGCLALVFFVVFAVLLLMG